MRLVASIKENQYKIRERERGGKERERERKGERGGKERERKRYSKI